MNNLSFISKTFRNEEEIDNEIKNIESDLNYYKSFDDIEGVGNLKINVLNSLMNEYRNIEWMRGVIVDNVRDGEISENSKQAVNGSQIYHLRKELNDKINNNAQRVEQVEKRLDQTTKEMRAGIAGAYALNGISQASLPGQSAIGVGVGNFKGASALAIGISKKTENGKVSFKLGGSVNTNKDVGVSGGVTYFF